MDFDVLVEIPKGQRNKYEVDHKTGRIRLDRTLFTATQVTSIANSITPPDTTGLPVGLSLRLIDSESFPRTPYLVSADAWAGSTVPFAWRSLLSGGRVSTVDGCTFCVAQRACDRTVTDPRAYRARSNRAQTCPPSDVALLPSTPDRDSTGEVRLRLSLHSPNRASVSPDQGEVGKW